MKVLKMKFFALNLFILLTYLPTFAQEYQQLYLNQSITNEIKKGERQNFVFSLEENQFARIEVEQNGFQVSFDIFSPENQRIIRINKPAGAYLSKRGSILSSAKQTFRVEVFVSLLEKESKGTYQIKLSSLRPARENDAKIIEAEKLFQNIQLEQIIRKNRQSLDQAVTVAKMFKEANDEEYLAASYLFLGQWHTYFIEHEKAVDFYDQAIKIFQKLNSKRNLAFAFLGKGTSLNYLGEPQPALDSLEKSLEIYKELKDDFFQVEVMNQIALVLNNMGSPEKALIYLQQAGSKGLKSVALERTFGLTYFALGDYNKSIEHFKKLESYGGDFPAVTLLRNGVIHSKVKEYDKAFEYFEAAIKVHKGLQNKYLEAMTQTFWGEAEFERNEKEKALEHFRESLRLRNEIADLQGEAVSRYWLAKIEFDKGKLENALSEIEKAVAISENYRTKIGSDELKTSYFASVSDYYELYLEILTSLHRKLPNDKFDEKSFEVSEKARARSLLDLLTESRAEIRQGIEAILLKKERDTQNRLNEIARSLMSIRRGEDKITAEKEVELLWQKTLLELDDVRAEIRQKSPKYANLTQPKPLTVKEAQNLLDDETILLEYKLGKERSFLWVVTKNELKVFELPKREELDKIGKEFYETVVSKGKIEEVSVRLSKILFPQNIKNKRILVVADGILQYLPFSALVENELIILPSVSVLSEIRQSKSRPNEKLLTIFADAVFDQNDSRLPSVAGKKQTPDATNLSKVSRENNFAENLPRLLSSRFEAQNIASLVGKDEVYLHLDFEANRENVINEDLAKYQVVHLATHGILNSTRPEFSGLVFSLFDKEGKFKDGFLRLDQIYNLSLNSDLVVLSACQTALGKDVRGEGLIGLTRGFMYAGAKRIVASLWKVDDVATAEFMKKFYQNLLVKKLKPATALRQTQNEMKLIPRFKSPYYWAGFTIQGDWK